MMMMIMMPIIVLIIKGINDDDNCKDYDDDCDVVADDHHNVDHDDGDEDDEIVFPGRRSARGFFPSPLSGSRHSCSGLIKQHKWVPALNSTSYNCLAFSFQLCLQVASNLRTSCEQTDNAFKKRVDEVFLKFTIKLVVVVTLTIVMVMIILVITWKGNEMIVKLKRLNSKNQGIQILFDYRIDHFAGSRGKDEVGKAES